MKQLLKEIGIRYLQIIPLVTFISAGIMYVVFSKLSPESDPDVRITLISAFIYTTIFTGVLVPSFRLLEHYIPILSVRNILTHIVVMTILTLGCYFLSSWLTLTLVHMDSPLDIAGQFIAFLLTVMITVTILGVFYFRLFQERDKNTREQAVKAELSALRAQVNPHFLFNSLNSIAALVRLDAAKSEEVTEDLAELFRYSLNASKKETVFLSEEIEAVRLYLSIEKARFGDRLISVFDISKDTEQTRVPALIIQPLVENAVKHGIQHSNNPLKVHIKSFPEGESLVIEVTDTGRGLDPAQRSTYLKQGTGLSNILKRLDIQYGRRGQMVILENGIRLELPFEPRNNIKT